MSAPAFPWLDRTRPGLLDVLIGLEEEGMALALESPGEMTLVGTGPRRLPPAWLVRGLREHHDELARRLARRPDPCLAA